MTNSYNSSSRPRVLLIHGLNNNHSGFAPLKLEIEKLGFECLMITLPGHGTDRNEARSLSVAFKSFQRELKDLIHENTYVVAFSQGGLYLQLWLESESKILPKAQVLLAPALFINYQNRLEKLVSFLPSFGFILSQTPKKLRLYQRLFVWEYRTLFEAIKKFQSQDLAFRIPTMVLVDPQDELIDAKKLETELKKRNSENFEFHYVNRLEIPAPGLGKHHVLFHPDYFNNQEWKQLILRIKSFFNVEV
jgi:esterase/lipase